jgi:hypothetical protein
MEILVDEGALGIALDLAAAKMYWTNRVEIRRANLEGTGQQTLVTGTVFNDFASIALQVGIVPIPVWNLATDFRIFPNQANPNPDSLGNPDVWHFMESSSLAHDPKTYKLLSEFIPDAFFIQDVQQWQNPFNCSTSCNDKLPAVGINATGTLQHPTGMDWPAAVVRMHPFPDQLSIIGWRSPINGKVTIRGTVTDLDSLCGNGVAWSIDSGSHSLAQGVLPNGNFQAFELPDINVTQGSFIYFIIDPNGDHFCDSTGLDLTITTLELANSLVSFQPLRTTFRTTSDTAGCAVNSIAKFLFEARLTNTSTQRLSSGLVQVAEIASDDQLLQLLTDTELITRGGAFPVPEIGAYADGVLSPQEAVDVPFTVCLKSLPRFRLFVDVWAQVVP